MLEREIVHNYLKTNEEKDPISAKKKVGVGNVRKQRNLALSLPFEKGSIVGMETRYVVHWHVEASHRKTSVVAKNVSHRYDTKRDKKSDSLVMALLWGGETEG